MEEDAVAESPQLPVHNTTLTSDATHTRSQQQQIAANLAYRETLKTGGVVAFYLFVSISLIFLNKEILEEEFPYPFMFTWLQQVISLGCFAAVGQLGKSWAPASVFPPIEFDPFLLQKIAPVAFIYFVLTTFNNLCIEYVDVAYYQVVRSLTVPFTVFLSYFLNRQRISKDALKMCIMVFAGFVLASIGEMYFSIRGVFFGIVASGCVSLYTLKVRGAMQIMEGNQWKLLMYHTIGSIILLLPCILLFDMEFIGKYRNWDTLFHIIISGILSFLVHVAVALQLAQTSPLMNNISGTMKACLQTLLAVVFYIPPPFLNVVGIILVIIGSFIYSNIRYSEMTRLNQAQLPTRNV